MSGQVVVAKMQMRTRQPHIGVAGGTPPTMAIPIFMASPWKRATWRTVPTGKQMMAEPGEERILHPAEERAWAT